jgi:hypothetical protein
METRRGVECALAVADTLREVCIEEHGELVHPLVVLVVDCESFHFSLILKGFLLFLSRFVFV